MPFTTITTIFFLIAPDSQHLFFREIDNYATFSPNGRQCRSPFLRVDPGVIKKNGPHIDRGNMLKKMEQPETVDTAGTGQPDRGEILGQLYQSRTGIFVGIYS